MLSSLWPSAFNGSVLPSIKSLSPEPKASRKHHLSVVQEDLGPGLEIFGKGLQGVGWSRVYGLGSMVQGCWRRLPGFLDPSPARHPENQD